MVSTQFVEHDGQPDATPSKRFHMSPEELQKFHENGYAGPFTLFSPEEMKTIWRRQRLALMNRSKAAYPADTLSGNTNLANYDRHLDSDFLADVVCRREIVDRVSSVLGPDVLCWRSEFFTKYPGEEGTDWHQADTFAMASGKTQIEWPGEVKDAITKSPFGGTITVWLALSEADISMGALQFIPGTHRTMYFDETGGMTYDPDRINKLEKSGVKRGFFGYDYRELKIDPDWEPDESKAVSVPCRAGQFIVFWSTLMHASHPHAGLSQDYRVAFACRYLPPSVKIYPGTDYLEEYGARISLEKYGAVVVAGKNGYSHNRIATHTLRGKPFSNVDD